MSKLLKTLSLAAVLALSGVPVARAEGFAGAFLAAKSANMANDYAEAAYYFTQAMIAEPDNGFVMQGALFAFVATGDISAAEAIARKMAAAGFKDEYAHVVMITAALQRQDYQTTLALLADGDFPQNPLINQMFTGWAQIGAGDTMAGLGTFNDTNENLAISDIGSYNMALAAAYLGDLAGADEIFAQEGSYISRGAVLAHGQIMGALGRREEALALLVEGAGAGFGDRVADDLRARLANGAPVVFDRVTSPQAGAGETMNMLADFLVNDGSLRQGLFYARLAVALNPQNAEALLLVGDALSRQGQYALALQAYQAVPARSPLALNAVVGQAQIQRQQGDLDGAVVTLHKALELEPEGISLWQTLGDMLRQKGDLSAAREAYSTAIELLPDPDLPAAWQLYYARGIVEHRADNWPAAEAEFRHALSLNPDQPDVLNYLGYSLVDQGRKLEEALAMIEKAVAARPESGAIADSLGWAYYRLGRYQEAEAAMEVAVKLLPVDPILSDHYGDVLWMVGRRREARFQWRRALSYGPEEGEAARIRDKLARGLDAVLADENGQE